MHNKESDGYGPVCRPFLPRGTRYLSMILHRPDGQYHPMRQSDCLRWLFFSESTGYRQVSAHCLSYARLLYPYFPDSRPTGHVSPLPGYGFLRPTDLLPAILQAYPSPIPHSPLSSRCGLPRRMYSLSRFLAPVRHLPSNIIRKTKCSRVLERNVIPRKTKRSFSEIFSTGLRRFMSCAETGFGHHPNPVRFVASLPL